MSDTTPEDRLLAALRETPTEAYVSDAHALMAQAESRLDALDDEERVIQSIYFEGDLANLRIQQAQVEQLRIANLLTVALDSHSPVGSPMFNIAARKQARDEALRSLGLPLDLDEEGF